MSIILFLSGMIVLAFYIPEKIRGYTLKAAFLKTAVCTFVFSVPFSGLVHTALIVPCMALRLPSLSFLNICLCLQSKAVRSEQPAGFKAYLFDR